jgi:hypothetical protein
VLQLVAAAVHALGYDHALAGMLLLVVLRL